MTAIRRASPEDAPLVARLLHEFNSEFDDFTPGADALAPRYARLIEKGAMIVLLAGEGPEGFAQLRFRESVLTGKLDAYLEELYVVPSRRGEGIGRGLLEAAMDASREEGATHIDLGTGEDDVAARALYESAGFDCREGRPDGAVQFFYEREL